MTLTAPIIHHENALQRLVPAMVGLGRHALVVADDALLSQSLALALSSCGVTARAANALPWRPSAQQEVGGTAVVVLAAVSPSAARRTVAALVGDGRRVVIVAASASDETLAGCVEMGAEVMVSGDVSLSDLATILSDLGRGGPVISPIALKGKGGSPRTSAGVLEARRRLDLLTKREQEILASLMAGRRAAVIATNHFVSLHTVRTQIRSLLRKLDVHSQVEAVAVAHRAGWTPGPSRD